MKTINKCCNNPTTVNTDEASRSVEGKTGKTSSFTLLVQNPDFLPGMQVLFGGWVTKGISSLGCLFLKDEMYFNQAVEAFGIRNNSLFHLFSGKRLC